MIFNFQVDQKTVKQISTVNINYNDVKDFPALNIGIDSYVVSSEIQTAIDFGTDYTHNIQIGNYCSIASNLTMIINLTHDHKSVTTSRASFLPRGMPRRLKRRGQIIIQNDVYIGNRVMILSGAKIGNGAVIGAGSVISKDIPPYAIAAGDPCKVIRYRFTPDQIEKLQLIRWWDFDVPYLTDHVDAFSEDIDAFIDRFYPEALERKQQLYDINVKTRGTTFLFFPDFGALFPVWERVLRSFCTTFTAHDDATLLIFIPKNSLMQPHLDALKAIVDGSTESPDIVVVNDDIADERLLFMKADYFITTRDINTVRWSTYADELGVKILSGVDVPIFGEL